MSACRFADKHGDALFRRTVDGTDLHGVTMWFYGTLPAPTQDRQWNRIKQFSVSELLLLLDELNARAHAFMRSASSLPPRGHEAPTSRGQEVELLLRQGTRIDPALLSSLPRLPLAPTRSETAISRGPRVRIVLGRMRLTCGSGHGVASPSFPACLGGQAGVLRVLRQTALRWQIARLQAAVP